MGCSTALDLLAIPAASVPPGPVTRRPIVVPSADVEVVLDPSWLLDLHDPTLVISYSYVGPDRRRTDRSWDQGEWRPRRWAGLLRRAVQVVVLTTAVVVPLVLIASPALPPATRGVPAPATVRVHRSPNTSRSMTPQPARIDTAAPAAPVPEVASVAVTSTSPGPTARAATEAQAAQHRAAARAARAAARADRAAARADRLAARAQVRTDRLAARAQARADRAAARAARAAARSRHGGRNGVPSVG